MGRPFIVLGDQTDHGGQVIEASGMSFVHGKRIARVGDKVTCPERGHGHTTVIVTGDPTMVVDGQPVARHGDQCACGAILLASQGVAGAGSAAAPAAPQRPNVEAEVGKGLAVQQAVKTRPVRAAAIAEPLNTARLSWPKGTIYWGGAGLDGPYVKPQVQAFVQAGIQNVWIGLNNTATRSIGKAGTLVDAIRAGLVIRYEDHDEWTIGRSMDHPADQFNLIGYSYGSLLAAQTANYYSKRGHSIDHLVLIGSPIDGDFLYKLRAYRSIKKVIVIDLTEHGDPIHAGMSQSDLLAAVPQLGKDMGAGKGEGHFYYAHVVPDSNKRWARLAEKLHAEGLR